MTSSGKKRTTMAKLTRESKLRERRLDKQARKDARRQAASYPEVADDALNGAPEQTPSPGAVEPAPGSLVTPSSTPEPAQQQSRD
jgi:hypothetical protein